MTGISVLIEHSNACWQCGASVHTEVSCAACGVLLPPSSEETYFSTFGLALGMDVSGEVIKEEFFQLSRLFHPDFYGDGTPQEQAISLDRSSRLNDAYRTLSDFYLRLD
jgi:molecular chaperone HscB